MRYAILFTYTVTCDHRTKTTQNMTLARATAKNWTLLHHRPSIISKNGEKVAQCTECEKYGTVPRIKWVYEPGEERP